MSNQLKELIIESLREVYDPEIPINVYDLGLIYEINVLKSSKIHILMTLTSPTCPTADYIKEMISDAVSAVDGVSSVEIELTFEPLWNPDMVTDEAKEELGLTQSSEDLSLQNTFSSSNSNSESLSVCFNCSATDNEFPLIAAKYKSENIFICAKCINKFK